MTLITRIVNHLAVILYSFCGEANIFRRPRSSLVSGQPRIPFGRSISHRSYEVSLFDTLSIGDYRIGKIGANANHLLNSFSPCVFFICLSPWLSVPVYAFFFQLLVSGFGIERRTKATSSRLCEMQALRNVPGIRARLFRQAHANPGQSRPKLTVAFFGCHRKTVTLAASSADRLPSSPAFSRSRRSWNKRLKYAVFFFCCPRSYRRHVLATTYFDAVLFRRNEMQVILWNGNVKMRLTTAGAFDSVASFKERQLENSSLANCAYREKLRDGGTWRPEQRGAECIRPLGPPSSLSDRKVEAVSCTGDAVQKSPRRRLLRDLSSEFNYVYFH